MTAQAVAQGRPAALRAVLWLYPKQWRDDHEEEIASTLLDVAEAEGRTSPPLDELANLALRGAWMRARSSTTFWIGLLIVVGMGSGLSQQYEGFHTERYWPAIQARAGSGLLLALPLAALAAAWRGRRARIGKASVRLRQAALDTAPILAVVALGYLAAVFAQLAVSGLPLTLTTNLGIPLAYACLSAGAISLGYALGSVVQVAVSAPVAFLVVAGYFRVVPNGWQNLTGGSVMQTGYTLYHEVLPGSLVSMTVIGLAVVGMGCLVVAARPILPRLLTLGAVLLASVAIVPLVGAPALAAVGTGSSLARDPAQLVCSGTDPEICLWPEQDAEGGAEIREAHTDAYRDARALGVGVPSHIASEWGYGYDRPDSTGLAWRYSQSPDELLVNYAVVALLPSFSCHAARTDVSHPRAQQVVTYAFALAIGADGTLAMPTLSAVTEGDDAPLGFAESQDYLGVHDLAEARTVLRDWVAAPVC